MKKKKKKKKEEEEEEEEEKNIYCITVMDIFYSSQLNKTESSCWFNGLK